jgi:hypothetical protein
VIATCVLPERTNVNNAGARQPSNQLMSFRRG